MTALRPRFVQARKTTLQSPITDTESSSIVLKNLVDIYGNQLAITDFVPKLYLTIDPAGQNEEVISCTGFTVNSDSTVTLDTGITRGLAVKYAYAAGGTAHDHAAGVVVVVSDQPQLIEAILSYIDDIAVSGSPLASTTSKGIVEEATQAEVDAGTQTGSTAAELFINPTTLRAKMYHDYAADAGVTDDYAITVAPAITAYATGQRFIFKVATANTGPATLNVCGLGAKTIKKGGGVSDLDDSNLIAGGIYEVIYDGTNMQLVGSAAGIPAGTIQMWAVGTAPAGYLLCDGTAVSRASYPSLFSAINPSLGTVTVTIASPGVFSLTAHGLVEGDIVYLTTTGALPTGLSANTIYYVIAAGLTADAFEVSATRGGSVVNTSGSQSGVHTLRRSPYGIGDGSTTFNVPNAKGKVIVGNDPSDTVFATGETGGEKTHTLTIPEMPRHYHYTQYNRAGTQIAGSAGNNQTLSTDPGTSLPTGYTGDDGAHNNLQPYLSMQFIIKT